MKKLGITKEKLLKRYIKEINDIADKCEWKSTFSGEEVCSIVCSILVKNKCTIEITNIDLFDLYSKKIESLALTREEYVNNFGMKEIIDIIYDILIEKNS